MKKILQNLDKTLFLIVILAAALRFAYLTYTPPSLNWDEVSHGYNAYSILTTGKDEWGVSFPTIFRAYGDYKLPVYIYLTAISEKLFGLNGFAVRLPSALAGIGTVIFTYLLVYELFKKKPLANLSAFLVAVEPWSLFLSRGGFEANLALFFIISGVYYFVRSFRDQNSYFYLLPFTFLLGLSVWTYNSARIFVPILLFVLTAIYWNDLKNLFFRSRKLLIINSSLLIIFFVPMFIQLAQPIGQARYGKVSIINEGTISSINQARGASHLPLLLNRLVNNKVTFFTGEFIKNWVSHYSSSFLFAKGGTNYQFSIPGRGILYWVDVIPMTIGLLWLVIKRSKENTLLIAWFLFSPIASALTNEAPQVLRSIVMLPVPMIISAIGAFQISEYLKNKFKISPSVILTVYIIAVYLFFENYATAYIISYRTNYSWSWQYGYEQVVNYAKNHYKDYDKIIVTKKYGEPHEFFLYFLGWNSDKYRNDPNLIRFAQSDWFWVDRFDKFYFVNNWQIKLNSPELSSIQEKFVTESKHIIDCNASKCLLITSPGNYPPGWVKLDTVNFLDNSPAFEIYEN